MGDLSGKYGTLPYNAHSKSIVFSAGSPYDVDSYDLTGKSLLIRCGFDQSRALCAPFEEYNVDRTDMNIENGYTLIDFEETYYNRPYQNYTFSKIAYLSQNSYILLTYENRYEISIDVGELTIPGNCGDEIFYRIFTDFDDSGSSSSSSLICDEDCCDGNVGSFYDPTLTCNEDTENTEKGYCIDDDLCGNNNYEYTCEVNGYYLSQDRHKCGPGDLSNKYGSIDISQNAYFWFNRTGGDALMIPLSQLDGKSIVLQCENDYRTIACAPFEDYTLDAGQPGHVGPYFTDSDSDDTSEDNDKNENTILGVSQTVVMVMIVLGILTLIPCVRALCRKAKSDRGIPRSRATAGSVGAIVISSTNNSERHRKHTHSDVESQSGGIDGDGGVGGVGDVGDVAGGTIAGNGYGHGNGHGGHGGHRRSGGNKMKKGHEKIASRSRERSKDSRRAHTGHSHGNSSGNLGARSRSVSRSQSNTHTHTNTGLSRSHSRERDRSTERDRDNGDNRDNRDNNRDARSRSRSHSRAGSKSRSGVGGAAGGAAGASSSRLDEIGADSFQRKSPIPRGYKPTTDHGRHQSHSRDRGHKNSNSKSRGHKITTSHSHSKKNLHSNSNTRSAGGPRQYPSQSGAY